MSATAAEDKTWFVELAGEGAKQERDLPWWGVDVDSMFSHCTARTCILLNVETLQRKVLFAVAWLGTCSRILAPFHR